MKHLITFLCLFGAGTAQAACFVEYKAKIDDPLKLHYGIMQTETDCTLDAVEPDLDNRLSNAGWTLLTVLSASSTLPTSVQKDNAGEFFLRF